MTIDAELAANLDLFPLLDLTRESLLEVRTELNEQSREAVAAIEGYDHISVKDRFVTGPATGARLRLRIYSPPSGSELQPCLLWIHGGGYILGCPEMDELMIYRTVDSVRCTVVAPDYRLAPEHPYPAACDDCAYTLDWILKNANELSIRTRDIAIGGASAGAGLAASLALRCKERRDNPIQYQCLIYPMLDHRNVRDRDRRITDYKLWTVENNRFAWDAYLNGNSIFRETSALESPALADALEGLPPTYMCIGDLDLFYDECKNYARRLDDAGVAVELHVVPGAVHGFDAFPVQLAEDELTRRFRALSRHFEALVGTNSMNTDSN